jgi:SAM-dependent methyltransferase
MDELPFATHSLDIIWSEGAIYNMGFANGVQQWSRYLKPGGYLAVSEITWITQARPTIIEDFWQREYPEIDTAAAKFTVLENAGYTPLGYFVLSPDEWIDTYYAPMEAGFAAFLARHDHSEAAQAIVEEHRQEIQFFREYQDYYSYGFYLARKG